MIFIFIHQKPLRKRVGIHQFQRRGISFNRLSMIKSIGSGFIPLHLNIVNKHRWFSQRRTTKNISWCSYKCKSKSLQDRPLGHEISLRFSFRRRKKFFSWAESPIQRRATEQQTSSYQSYWITFNYFMIRWNMFLHKILHLHWNRSFQILWHLYDHIILLFH